jgi:hypothetical protein
LLGKINSYFTHGEGAKLTLHIQVNGPHYEQGGQRREKKKNNKVGKADRENHLDICHVITVWHVESH